MLKTGDTPLISDHKNWVTPFVDKNAGSKFRIRNPKGAAGLSSSGISNQISSKKVLNEYGIPLGQRPTLSTAKNPFRNCSKYLLL